MSDPCDVKVVALGGGHGLSASLSALRRVTADVTAIVTVADDGGSSGRLRREFGMLPPGDLRMALAALCGDDEWGTTWSRVVQHRFGGSGELAGHSAGNLLIAALWDLLGDPVAGLDWVARLLRVTGRVLPMAAVPLDIIAMVEGADPARPDDVTAVRGQAACAKTTGKVRSISLQPADPPAVPDAVSAVRDANWVVFGPGSWFTSVLPHLFVPALAKALHTTSGAAAGRAQPGGAVGGDRGLLAAPAPGGARRARARPGGGRGAGRQAGRARLRRTSWRRPPGCWAPGWR